MDIVYQSFIGSVLNRTEEKDGFSPSSRRKPAEKSPAHSHIYIMTMEINQETEAQGGRE